MKKVHNSHVFSPKFYPGLYIKFIKCVVSGRSMLMTVIQQHWNLKPEWADLVSKHTHL